MKLFFFSESKNIQDNQCSLIFEMDDFGSFNEDFEIAGSFKWIKTYNVTSLMWFTNNQLSFSPGSF